MPPEYHKRLDHWHRKVIGGPREAFPIRTGASNCWASQNSQSRQFPQSRGSQAIREVSFQAGNDTLGLNASTQVFVLNQCSNDNCRNSSLRLRNIGLVLAEMVLAVPLRSRSESAGTVEAPSYKQFVNGHWKNIYLTKIII
jgi:hypothetical protein